MRGSVTGSRQQRAQPRFDCTQVDCTAKPWPLPVQEALRTHDNTARAHTTTTQQPLPCCSDCVHRTLINHTDPKPVIEDTHLRLLPHPLHRVLHKRPPRIPLGFLLCAHDAPNPDPPVRPTAHCRTTRCYSTHTSKKTCCLLCTIASRHVHARISSLSKHMWDQGELEGCTNKDLVQG